MGNSYKWERKLSKRITLTVIIIIIYLLSVTSYDAFIGNPKKNIKIEQITSKFNDLKIYLDAKLPKIDSALIKHAKQIDNQNIQLEELNNLTKILKEENNE